MSGPPSLHRRAFPMAIAVGLVAMMTLLSDAVCGSQVLALAGPVILSITYPLSGLCIGIAALIQFSSIDHRPRLTILKVVCLGYAALFSVALALALMGIAPVVTTTAVWLLSDQVNVLFPVLLWSLAGDVFNAAEGKKVFGWMMGWSYAAQVVGLAITMLSPLLFSRLGIPLPALLIVNPLSCIVIAVWIPRTMRGGNASKGLPKGESTKVALTDAGRFFKEVPAWRALFMSTTIASIAAITALIGFGTAADNIIGSDAGLMQAYFALGSLVVLLGCGAYQWLGSERLNQRVGVAGQFAVLPVGAIIGGLLIAFGGSSWSLVLLIIGMSLVDIPNFSVDENTRHTALTLIPDQVRARISLVVDLGRNAVGFFAAGLLALIGTSLGQLWLTGIIASLAGAAALAWAIVLRRRWDHSMLNWRLRRRKHSSMDALHWAEDE
jgi:AAA family ATP:ADP antiporter